MDKLMTGGKSHLVFVIGGSLGLSDDVLKRADYKLSFSKMTIPPSAHARNFTGADLQVVSHQQ